MKLSDYVGKKFTWKNQEWTITEAKNTNGEPFVGTIVAERYASKLEKKLMPESRYKEYFWPGTIDNILKEQNE